MIKDINHLKELSLAEKLARVSRLWKNVADKELTPLGLTHPRWTALWKLQRMGDNISQKALADALEIELGSLMRTLNQLEEQQLILRKSCESDKRAKIVCLTQPGVELLKQVEQRIIEVRQLLLNDIDDEQLNQFSQLLEKIACNATNALS